MPALQPLCMLMDINPFKFTKEENILLETELFLRICDELKEVFREQQKSYFRLIKFNKEMENTMLEKKLTQLIIKDILSTNEYTLEGIAHYTNSHEDVIQEIAIGKNLHPSATLLRRVVEIHRTVRRELYQMITKKIAAEYIARA